MMAPGFKPVGWVAAVAGSAIACYMLSLNVASERAELSRIERQIVETKQNIRLLQTELGTRGRLAQLEQWNADVLALSAPTTTQFLDNEVKLARFDRTEPTLDERAEVRLAAAELPAQPANKPAAPVLQASAPVAAPSPTPAPAPRVAVAAVEKKQANPLLRQASLTVPPSKLAAPGPLSVQPQRPAKPVVASAPSKPAKPIAASSAQAKPQRASASAVTASKPSKPSKPSKQGAPVQLLPTKLMQTASAEAAPKPAKPAAKPMGRIDPGLAQQIAAAAKLEAGHKGR